MAFVPTKLFYSCNIDDKGRTEFFDTTNGNSKYEEDVTPWLPLLTPEPTQAGTVVSRQPKIPVQSKAWWRAQCGFRGLQLDGTVMDLQARLRAHGSAGVSSDANKTFHEIKWNFFSLVYAAKTDGEKADGWPGRLIAECFGPNGSRRDEVVVVEVSDWGNKIHAAAREAGVCKSIRKMPHHETGQRRVVLGLDEHAVSAHVAELDRDEVRAEQRARREEQEEGRSANAEFKRFY